MRITTKAFPGVTVPFFWTCLFISFISVKSFRERSSACPCFSLSELVDHFQGIDATFDSCHLSMLTEEHSRVVAHWALPAPSSSSSHTAKRPFETFFFDVRPNECSFHYAPKDVAMTESPDDWDTDGVSHLTWEEYDACLQWSEAFVRNTSVCPKSSAVIDLVDNVAQLWTINKQAYFPVLALWLSVIVNKKKNTCWLFVVALHTRRAPAFALQHIIEILPLWVVYRTDHSVCCILIRCRLIPSKQRKRYSSILFFANFFSKKIKLLPCSELIDLECRQGPICVQYEISIDFCGNAMPQWVDRLVCTSYCR